MWRLYTSSPLFCLSTFLPAQLVVAYSFLYIWKKGVLFVLDFKVPLSFFFFFAKLTSHTFKQRYCSLTSKSVALSSLLPWKPTSEESLGCSSEAKSTLGVDPRSVLIQLLAYFLSRLGPSPPQTPSLTGIFLAVFAGGWWVSPPVRLKSPKKKKCTHLLVWPWPGCFFLFFSFL